MCNITHLALRQIFPWEGVCDTIKEKKKEIS